MYKILSFVLFLCIATNSLAVNIVFIVPAGVGSASDLLARKLAQELSYRIKETIVVEDYPGGDQVIGLARAEKATQPTLFLGGTSLHVFNPVFTPDTVQNLDSNLDVFATMAHGYSVWYTYPNSGINNVQDMVNGFRQNKKLNIGSDLLPSRMNAELLKYKYRTSNAEIIVYKTSAQNLIDVAGGNIILGVNVPSTGMAGLIAEGKILPLANTSDQSVIISGITIPQMSQSIKRFKSGWFLSTVKKAPISDDIIKTLQTIIQDPEIKKYIIELGLIPEYYNRPDTQKYIENYRSELRLLAGQLKSQ